MNKKILLFGLPILAIALVSAAVIYYTVFSVNVNVHQPISFSGDLEQTVTDCNAGETCLGQAITILNDGDNSRTVKIVKISGDENIVVSYVGKLELTKKDTTTWTLLDDKVELIYTLVGNDFEYSGVPDGYTLIYYKDAIIGLEGRLANPQPAIVITSDIGNLAQSDDANLNADYSLAPDNYLHKVGAKLWAVPNTAITGNVLDWSQMNNFYYESDLISYFDNSNNEIIVPAGSSITFYPTFTPSVYTDSGEYEFTFEIQ